MPAAIPVIIGLAATGVTTGLEAAGTFQPSTTAANQELLQQQEKAQQQQQLSAEQQAWKQAAPNAQAQTGGGLSGPSLEQLISELSGSPGTIPQIQQAIYGTTTPGTSSTDYQVT